MENLDQNLDIARDEKCIPLATAIIGDMQDMLIADDANESVDYNPIVGSILKKLRDSDTNVTTENPYVFQLILGGLSGLNAAIQKCDVQKIDDVRYGIIEKKILSILNNSGIIFGPTSKEDMDEKYSVLVPKLNELFDEEKLSWMEVKYVSDVIFEAFKTVASLVNQSVEISMEKAEAKLFGVDSMSDVTMQKVDEVLKSE